MTGEAWARQWRIDPTMHGVTLTHVPCGQVTAPDLPQPVTLEVLTAAAADHRCPLTEIEEVPGA